MQFAKNAPVYSHDGQSVGRITHVVLDPVSKKVTHVVVRQGKLFKDDRVVPIQMFQSSCPQGVILGEGNRDLHSLPEFEKTRYIPVDLPQDVEAVKLAGMVGGLYLYPSAEPERFHPHLHKYPQTPVYRYVLDVEQNIPAGEVALREGAYVMSADYQHVGNIESVIVDTQTDNVTSLVVLKHALLTKTRKLVPVSWIKSVHEDEVNLTVDACEVIDLPEYETIQFY